MSLPFPILTAEEAGNLIEHGSTIGFSGFTPAGAAKAIPKGLAAKAKREHAAGREFTVGVLTGASTGPSLDGPWPMPRRSVFALLTSRTGR